MHFKRLLTFLLPILLFLGACSPVESPSATPLPPTRRVGSLVFYQTPTPSPALPTPTPLAKIPVTPAPTPTPFTHVIVKGDTLLDIALRYGVKPEDIQAANPEMDPNFLVVDSTLVIPLEGGDPAALPTPTPLPLETGSLSCSPTEDEGLWCFVLITNNLSLPVENISAWVGLYTKEGENVRSDIALPPLNVLSPDQAMPVTVFFPAPLPPELTARSELLGALEVFEEGRYLETKIEDLEVEITGIQAAVTGLVRLEDEQRSASRVWVAVVAYAENGDVVGVRKWESDDLPGCDAVVFQPIENGAPEITPQTTLERSSVGLPEACFAFKTDVYSLGPQIDRVEVLVEARP